MALLTPGLIAAAVTSLTTPAPAGIPAMPSLGAPPRAAVVCGAPAPAVGELFAGPVLHVFDGRTLCVAQGPTPSQWIRVKLADGGDANDRAALMAAAFAERVVCVAERTETDGVVARCALDDVPLGRLTESPAVRIDAASWR